MRRRSALGLLLLAGFRLLHAAELPPAFPPDPRQSLERTCFQTGQAWSEAGNLRSDVAIIYGIDAGAEAIHLEEPEFWVRGGYSEGFKREWRQHYGEEWQPPHSSVDAQWRASKLKYHLYRRALQQVFDHVQAWNRRTGRQVRCYVPTHSRCRPPTPPRCRP
jgi:hypothetical protein